MKSFYELTENERNECKQIINNIDFSQLYLKNNCIGNFQEMTIVGTYIKITIKQKRLYDNSQPHRTNTEGDVFVIIIKSNSTEIEYESTINELTEHINWRYPERENRLIVPCNLLSESNIKLLTKKVFDNNLPTYSTETEQFVYFTDLDGAQGIISKYPTIKIEQKLI